MEMARDAAADSPEIAVPTDRPVVIPAAVAPEVPVIAAAVVEASKVDALELRIA